MSYCREEGKDRIIFLTEEDLKEPSTVKLGEDEEPAGLIAADGSINWNCPCLGGMATGPCGVEFREAFSCFHYSTAEPKGRDCYDSFQKMHECMQSYPALYGTTEDDDKELEASLEKAEAEGMAMSAAASSSAEKPADSDQTQPDSKS